jgi:hypothetical protein
MEDFAQNPCSSVPSVPHAQPVRFQAVTYLVGDKMKPRVAYFDLALIPDYRAWLEEHLGKVKSGEPPFKEIVPVIPAAGRSLGQNP